MASNTKPEWRPATDKDGKPTRYAETDGTYTVCACKSEGQWKGVLWRGKQMIAVFNSPREAKANAYDYA